MDYNTVKMLQAKKMIFILLSSLQGFPLTNIIVDPWSILDQVHLDQDGVVQYKKTLFIVLARLFPNVSFRMYSEI